MRKLAVVASYGRPRKHGYVRAFKLTIGQRELVRVQWREADGTVKTESFPDTRKGIAEAKAFASGVHDRLLAKPVAAAVSYQALTLRQMWEKYATAHAKAWRPKTHQSSADRWKKVELLLGKDTPASSVTPETLDGMVGTLIDTLTSQGRVRSTNQVRSIMALIRAVYRWASVERDLIPPTKVTSYRVELSKDLQRQVVEQSEYRDADRTKVLAQWNPENGREWRPWVLTTLLAYCGPRQNAARRLEVTDLDMAGRRIKWRPENDKMGYDRWQPMPDPVHAAFEVALRWREKDGYTGRFVFYAVQKRGREKDQPWTYQAYIEQLHRAEDDAGVPRVLYRGAHGFRRGIAGDVHHVTGSSKKAANWIGDKSTRVVEKHYLLDRDDALRETANLVSGEPK